MTRPDVSPRQFAFRRDYLAWTALHHFLPAGLVRELAIATLDVAAPETSLDALFSETLSEGPAVLASWALAPRPVGDRKLTYYQQHFRALAWSNDADISFYAPSRDEGEPTCANYLSDALQLGRHDLGVRLFQLKRLRIPTDSSLACLFVALSAAATETDLVSVVRRDTVMAALSGLPPELRAIAVKHFGDLFADADDWIAAAWFYACAQDLLGAAGEEWGPLVDPLRDIIAQSEAAAAWINEGPSAASTRLTRLAEARRDEPDSLGLLNGGHDTLMSIIRSGESGRDWSDLRAAVMPPPLLLGSFDVGRALQTSLNGKDGEAARHFWSVLRRHTALGGIIEARTTRAEYGRAMSSADFFGGRRAIDPDAFRFGVRLLVEAGLPEIAISCRFDRASVSRCVDAALIVELSELASRHPGAAGDRGLVLVELLGKWIAELEPDEFALAEVMLSAITTLARGRPATFDSSDNLGGRALKIIWERARAQPGHRHVVARPVLQLVTETLGGNGFWKSHEDALRIAMAYRDVWTPDEIRSVLSLLSDDLGAYRSGGESFVDRAAIDLLMTPEVQSAVRDSSQLGVRFFANVLRHRLAEQNNAVATLFNVSAFGSDLDLSEKDRAAVERVVAEVGVQAGALNSSGAVDAIRALLAAPDHAGPEGVRTALVNLMAVLDTAPQKRAPSFPYAYDPLLDLARRRGEIEEAARIPATEFQELIDQIGSALARAWSAIVAKPERLAPFALPPRREPDPILVNNFAVASTQYVKLLSDSGELVAALEAAKGSEVLGSIVHRAVVTGSQEAWTAVSALSMADEDSGVFYRLLGHRLVQAQSADRETRRFALGALLVEVLRRGPRELDLAVLAAASPAELGVGVPETGLHDYLVRLRADPDLLQLIGPAVYSLRSLHASDED